MTRDQLIETMARALAEHDGRDPDAAGTWFGGNKIWVDYESDAKAALTAIEAAGMRVVPAVFQNPTFDPNLSNRATPPAQEDSTSE